MLNLRPEGEEDRNWRHESERAAERESEHTPAGRPPGRAAPSPPRRPPRIGDRVDTPFGLGIVRAIGPHPDLLGGPYVSVELEAKGMVIDDLALLDPADVHVFQRASC